MEKIRTAYNGRLKKADELIGKRQAVIAMRERPTKQKNGGDTYCDVQAFVEGFGLCRYSTGAKLLVEVLKCVKFPFECVICKDWRGLYFQGTVYTVEEEEEMLRAKYNIQF